MLSLLNHHHHHLCQWWKICLCVFFLLHLLPTFFGIWHNTCAKKLIQKKNTETSFWRKFSNFQRRKFIGDLIAISLCDEKANEPRLRANVAKIKIKAARVREWSTNALLCSFERWPAFFAQQGSTRYDALVPVGNWMYTSEQEPFTTPNR